MNVAILSPVYGLYFQKYIFSIFSLLSNSEKINFKFISPAGSSNITSARNSTIYELLILEEEHKFKFDYLLFIDSDIIFTNDDFLKLLKSINNDNVGVVSGVYFSKARPYFPVAGFFDLNNVNEGFPKVSVQQIKSKKIVEIDWTGLGFVLVKREIIDKIEYPWFDMTIVDLPKPIVKKGNLIIKKEILSEDISFFTKIRKLDYKILLDTNVLLQHIGYNNFSVDHFYAYNS